jgi:hypothetical protein
MAARGSLHISLGKAETASEEVGAGSDDGGIPVP